MFPLVSTPYPSLLPYGRLSNTIKEDSKVACHILGFTRHGIQKAVMLILFYSMLTAWGGCSHLCALTPFYIRGGVVVDSFVVLSWSLPPCSTQPSIWGQLRSIISGKHLVVSFGLISISWFCPIQSTKEPFSALPLSSPGLGCRRSRWVWVYGHRRFYKIHSPDS